MAFEVSLLLVLAATALAFSGVRGEDDKNVLDKIFEVNQITANGQISFGSGTPELFEGDIVKNKRLEQDIKALKVAGEKGVSPFDAIARGQWPGGVIPYVFNSRFRGHSVVREAIADYSRYTCIKWVPRRSQRDYVEFFNGGGCYSMIGRQGGRQQISLGAGCLQKGVVIHEMMHAAGFFHEQSRLDRDNYITIVWGNINRAMQYNFQKYRPGQASTLGEPYDKQSVMHYGNYAFSINGQKTIISRSSSNERLGQRRGFSQIDIKQLNKYYQCDTTSTGSPPIPPTNCVDVHPFCPLLGKNKWCSNAFVGKNCKKSCGGCSAGQCIDKNISCPLWAKTGYCNRSYVEYMKQNCMKSCGLRDC